MERKNEVLLFVQNARSALVVFHEAEVVAEAKESTLSNTVER